MYEEEGEPHLAVNGLRIIAAQLMTLGAEGDEFANPDGHENEAVLR